MKLSRFRIEFQVREVIIDDEHPGAVDQSQARYVTFGDDVTVGGIKDFFERCGLACELMFKDAVQEVALVRTGNLTNKIAVIKLMREFCEAGLKDGKDAVEAGMGHPLVVFKDIRDARECLRKFHESGVREVGLAEVPRGFMDDPKNKAYEFSPLRCTP